MTNSDQGSPDYSGGLPDHHDPTSGIGGAPPARSALSLRLALAIFGLLIGIGLTIWAIMVEAPVAVIVLAGLLVPIAVVNIIVVARRKVRGEPG